MVIAVYQGFASTGAVRNSPLTLLHHKREAENASEPPPKIASSPPHGTTQFVIEERNTGRSIAQCTLLRPARTTLWESLKLLDSVVTKSPGETQLKCRTEP
jgi:hypothetical protein